AHTRLFWEAIERQRWIAFILAMASYVLWLSLRQVTDGGMPIRLCIGVAYGFYQWFCVVAVLGFARRRLNRDSATRRFFPVAILPFYCVPQTAIILMAYGLRGGGLPAGVEAAAIIGGPAAACVVPYEIVRRVGWLRPLFGLKPEAAQSALPMQPSGQAA